MSGCRILWTIGYLKRKIDVHEIPGGGEFIATRFLEMPQRDRDSSRVGDTRNAGAIDPKTIQTE